MSVTELPSAGMLPGGPGEGVQIVIAGDEFPTHEMTLSIGPQHPSTHGVLRILLELDGETVVKAVPDCGYLHTGIEKTCEQKKWQQVIPLVERMDYLSAQSNSMAFALSEGVERGRHRAELQAE